MCLFLASCSLSLACAHRPALPVLSPLPVTDRTDVVPELPLSTLVIPLAVPIAGVQDVLRQRVLIPSASEWTQVTAEGDSPEVSIRYQADLGTPQIAVVGPSLRTTLPIHYFGSLRARAHTPFGWMWLTKDTSWGTNTRRGTITLQIDSQIIVSPNWELSSRSSLTGLTLTAPDIDKVCGGKVLKVCVPVELVRDRVHRELERQVRERATGELAALDAQVASKVNLRAIAEQLWSRLQEATPAQGGEALSLSPQAMSLAPLAVQGDFLTSALRVWAYPRWSTAGETARTPVPPASESGSTSEDLYFDAFLTFATFNAGLGNKLAALPANHEGYRVQRVELLGAAEGAERWVVAVTIGDERGQAVVYGEAALLPAEAGVRLEDLRLPADSSALARSVGYAPEVLAPLLSQSARFEFGDMLANRAGAVRDLLARGVSPWPVVFQSPFQFALQAVHAAHGGVVIRVRAH